jgi:hypothetical protein
MKTKSTEKDTNKHQEELRTDRSENCLFTQNFAGNKSESERKATAANFLPHCRRRRRLSPSFSGPVFRFLLLPLCVGLAAFSGHKENYELRLRNSLRPEREEAGQGKYSAGKDAYTTAASTRIAKIFARRLIFSLPACPIDHRQLLQRSFFPLRCR